MRLLINDLKEEELKRYFKEIPNDIITISNNSSIKKCVGCFNCWIKTPATCVIKDDYQEMGKMISQSEEIIIVTKCTYGGYSPFVKNVMDRSTSYIHPYFTIRNGEMHHIYT
ncbi:NAD(P)H-dependent oxidoreductase [Clostridium sp.]|uniref:NAD(P)H-dependent oxidoreductase n=1 Tax=Clostridium sp. TaxID=1506 RepID=UPI003F3AA615